MKRNKLILAVILVCITILAFSLFSYLRSSSKGNVAKYVKLHETELTAFAEQIISNDTAEASYQGWEVQYFPGSDDIGIVQFTISSFGLVPSGTYKGFYYSPSNEPSGFQGRTEGLIFDGTGWTWSDGNSPSGYTEKITNCWYWFEVRF